MEKRGFRIPAAELATETRCVACGHEDAERVPYRLNLTTNRITSTAGALLAVFAGFGFFSARAYAVELPLCELHRNIRSNTTAMAVIVGLGAMGSIALCLFLMLGIAHSPTRIMGYAALLAFVIVLLARRWITSMHESATHFAYYDETKNEVVLPNSSRR